MERTIEVRHVSLEIHADFEKFTKLLEQSLGRFDRSLVEDLETNASLTKERLRQAEGEQGLMLFDIQDHGKLLNIEGSPRKAKQYVLGNPLIAMTMTRHDIRAGLYAPLRLFVHESEPGSIRIDYDKPSSLLGQFNNSDVTGVAQSLDNKLATLIQNTERMATSPTGMRAA